MKERQIPKKYKTVKGKGLALEKLQDLCGSEQIEAKKRGEKLTKLKQAEVTFQSKYGRFGNKGQFLPNLAELSVGCLQTDTF